MMRVHSFERGDWVRIESERGYVGVRRLVVVAYGEVTLPR